MSPKYTPRKKRKGYWKNYERANIKDYLKVWAISKDIAQSEVYPFKTNNRGRKPKLEFWEYVCISIIYIYFNDPFRETEKLLTLLTGKTLDHSNIIRWFSKLKRSYIDELTYKVHLEIIQHNDEGDYLADSSGITCDRYENNLYQADSRRELQTWKIHIFAQYLFVLGLVSILSVWSNHGDSGDSPAFRIHTLKPTRVKKGRKCHADKAYFAKENIRKAKKAGLIPNMVPQERDYSDATLKRAVRQYDTEARKKNRGLVETPFGGLETEGSMKIRLRKPRHRNIATSLLALKHNIKTLLRAKALNLLRLFSHQPRFNRKI